MNNREEEKKFQKLDTKKKKDEILKKCIAYNKKKYNTDPYFKVVCCMRSRISKLLKQKK